MITPATAYRRINKLVWMGRLPDATLVLVDNATIPKLHGITLDDGKDVFMKPVIVLNNQLPWGRTLVHEMIHVAEPELPHGRLFEGLVRIYWSRARKIFEVAKKRETPNGK